MTSNELPQGVAANQISLLLGHPDPATLLTPALRDAFSSLINAPQAAGALQYGPEQGTRGLIDWLVAKINREQGLTIPSRNLMVTAGSTHAVDMLARLYVKQEGTMLVEAPTYADALHIFRDHQIHLHAIPMDEDGLIPSDLEKQVAQLHQRGIVPGALYTIPNFHNPTGRTLSEARRLEILSIAQHYGFLIIEDDVYHDLPFEESVPASFYALAAGKQAVSIGSFSKTLAPGLRVGWILAPEEIIEGCVNCGTSQMGGGANPFTANLVAEYCRSGHWEEHLQSIRSLYQMRRDVALSALSRHMPAGVEWTHPRGGFFLWLTLPDTIFAQQIKQHALQQRVLVAAGEGFFVNPSNGKHHLRLAYSCAEPDDIEKGIAILGQVIRSL